jgi:hypothetical protein
MITFQFINKSYRPFLSKNILLKFFLYNIEQDSDPGSGSGFFQRSDPDPHQNGLDPQHCKKQVFARYCESKTFVSDQYQI